MSTFVTGAHVDEPE